ncbi:TPA: hypothetical protein ACH3X3_005657 [Trebouxia sp. C0006]
MANYYHEARAHAKNIKHMQDDNRRRAERRAEKAGVEAELPINLLRIDGRSCSVSLNDEQYQAVQGMEGMIPMNGQQDNLIDRFDGRALLDFYREPIISRQTKPKTEDELELEELLAFETYRDLVKLLQQNLSEEQGLIAAELRNIEERASARSAAAAAVGILPGQNAASASSGIPAGQGEFSAVGFSYGASADGPVQSRAGGPIEDLGEEASSESSDSDDEEQGTDQTCDLLAANLGIDHFSVMLRRADRQEEDEALGQVKRPKRLFSRKKAAQRAKRMAGQGAGTWGAVPALAPARGPLAGPRTSGHSSTHRLSRRDSPTYDYHGRKRSRSVSSSRSRSRSPRRRARDTAKPQFISEFSVKASRHSSDSWRDLPSRNLTAASSDRAELRRADIMEALPSKADPSVAGGPVSLPSQAAVLHGIRASDYHSRSTYGDRERKRDRDSERHHSDKPKAAPVAQIPNKTETPKERLKRMMAAQINKQVAKDSVKSAQKIAHEEKERKARVQIERMQYTGGRRSPSPERYRSRSRSPGHERRSNAPHLSRY